MTQSEQTYDYDDFRRVWNQSDTLAQAAATMKQTRAACACMASKLRKMGLDVKLREQRKRTTPLERRFWSYVRKSMGHNCWVWFGSKNKKGYGQIQQGPRGGRPLLAHRLSWELHFGPIPENIMVLHTCDNFGCVRPDHLFLGTAADNTNDMIQKKRGHWQENAPGHNW